MRVVARLVAVRVTMPGVLGGDRGRCRSGGAVCVVTCCSVVGVAVPSVCGRRGGSREGSRLRQRRRCPTRLSRVDGRAANAGECGLHLNLHRACVRAESGDRWGLRRTAPR